MFLKAGVLSRLEKQRDKLIAQKLILLQAACKGFLSRQKFKRLKVPIPWFGDAPSPPRCMLGLLHGVRAAVIPAGTAPRRPLHPEECGGLPGSPALALVAAAEPRAALAQR